MAIYVQQAFNLKEPPMPQSQAAPEIQGALDTTFVDDIEEQFFEQPPDWFDPPVAPDAPTFSPNMTDVQQLTRP
jgi:hypothetical protein